MLPTNSVEAFLDSLILGGDDSPWLFDLAGYTTYANWKQPSVAPPSGGAVTVLDVTGDGFLMFFQVAASAAIPHVTVTVDGTPYVFSGQASLPNSQGISPNRLTFPIPFKSSLKIEVTNLYTSAMTLYYDYTYMLRTGATRPNVNTLLAASQRKGAWVWTSGTTYATLVNITGSGYLLQLDGGGLGPQNGYTSNSIANVVVDGVQLTIAGRVMDDVHNSGNTKVRPLLGPVRFNSSLLVQFKSSDAGSNKIYGYCAYLLD